MSISIKDMLQIITKKIDNNKIVDDDILYTLKKIEYSEDLKESCLFFEWFIKLNSDKEMIGLSKKSKKVAMDRFENINYRIENSKKYYERDKQKYDNELKLLNDFSIIIRKFYYGIGLIKEKPIDNRSDKLRDININSL